ncbi:MAG TPA: LPS export ABC transporter permease LptF [Xanthomonadales bacterium]|nr:LPS export ABC transporter permease LptF [Xanthomonadales bacterium]
MIIDRYMLREVGLPFIAVSTVLLTIFSTYSLTRYLVDANAGLLRTSEVVSLTGLRSLVSLEVLLPLSFYFAVMLGMGRLYSDSEIYAMRSSGIGEKRLMRPVMALALVLAVLTGVLSMVVRPWAYERSYEIRAQAMASSELDRIRPAQFYHFDDSGRTVFIEHMSPDGRSINGVFVRTRKGPDVQVITSVNGRLDYHARPGFHRLTLFDAYLFKRVAEAPDLFAELGSFALWLSAGEAEPVGYKTKASPTRELIVSSAAPDKAELQWRLSTPLSALLLALLAIPLSRGRPRQGRYARILVALVIYAVYFNVLDVSRTWVEQGTSPTIGWVPGITLLLVIALYLPWVKIYRSRKNTRRRPDGS